ncbi:MAG: Tat pathway signal protein [Haloarculaceae archaeon]
MKPSPDSGVSRRAFVKAAVAIGGTAALSACLQRESDGESLDLPTGDPDGVPTRQHAWNDALSTDDHGNHVPPRHHVFALFDYDGDPETDREHVAEALRSLERAYAWHPEGLLFTVGYSPAYFAQFEATLPDSVDLPEPQALAPFEDPEPDTAAMSVHLASNYGSVVLGAEEALRGETDELNGVSVSGLPETFSRAERRTGFIGEGLPADHQDVDGVPSSEPVSDDAPMYMGFESGFEKSQATEDRVTIGDGPFSGGTTQQASVIRLDLTQWYEQNDQYAREAEMFCPFHAEEELIEGTGANLGNSNQMEAHGCPAHASDDAEAGVVGHAQKAARARDEDGPIILRRDFDSTDDDRATVHFISLQERLSDFVATRSMMNGTDLADEGAVRQRSNNGILQYMTVERRGNYLIPPREHRALPTPRPA